MLVCRRRASQHSQLRPDLVDAFLLDLGRETRTIRISTARTERVQRKSVFFFFCCGLSHLSLLVADPAVELFALQADEVISGLQDAAFGGDGASRVDVIPGHHPHRDSSALAFPDGIWDLKVSANSGGGNVTAHRSPPSKRTCCGESLFPAVGTSNGKQCKQSSPAALNKLAG